MPPRWLTRQSHRSREPTTYYDVVREAAPGLPGWTVYRPANLTSGIKGKLPIVVWSNGACTISNDGYVYFLTQIAAQGFVVVAFGAPGEHASPNGIAVADRLTTAIDWATSPPGHGGPKYFNQLDASRIASCRPLVRRSGCGVHGGDRSPSEDGRHSQ